MTTIAKGYIQMVPSMKDFGKQLEQGGESPVMGAGSKWGKILNKAMVVGGVVAVGKAMTSLVKLGADFEQTLGGVDTLFKDAAPEVKKYAQDAFQTAGLSANDYMKQVTSTSATMIKSLGGDTKKAAEMSNSAIVDMSDNANKMGTAMGSIQDAYQGFAKQNYTMLDNLKLGYGGTKTEMERLLKDAEKLTGKKFDISNYSDVTQAIHAIQEEMGIAGATADEAATTVEGSFNSMKAATTNLFTALTSGEGLDTAFKNFGDSVATFGKNALRMIGDIFKNIGKVIFDGIWNAMDEDQQAKMKDALLPLGQTVEDFKKQFKESFDEIKEALGLSGDDTKFWGDILVGAISGVIKFITLLVKGYTTALKKITPFLKGVAKGIRTVADGIKDLIDWFKKIPERVQGIATTIKSFWRDLLDTINNIFIKPINDVAGMINKALPGTPLGKIPLLADGGIVTKPTLAMIGEAGPEAVIPLSKAGATGNSYTISINGNTTEDIKRIVNNAIWEFKHYGTIGAI